MNTKKQEYEIIKAEKAVRNNPASSQLYQQLGWLYFFARRYEEAIATVKHAIELDPRDVHHFQLMGRAYLDAGQVEKALEAFQLALDLDPTFIEPYISLGVLYSWRLGEYETALETFQQALALDSKHPFALAQLGYTYACMGRNDEALTILEQTTRNQPENERALENLCMLYLSLQRYDDVVAACRRHIEINATINDPHRMMGYAYNRMGRYAEAIEELESAVALAPHIYEIRGTLARILHIVGRHNDADKHYAIAAELASADDEFGQASFAAVNGNVDKALALLDTALLKGQTLMGWIRIDPDLEGIRDDPRFKSFMASRSNSERS